MVAAAQSVSQPHANAILIETSFNQFPNGLFQTVLRVFRLRAKEDSHQQRSMDVRRQSDALVDALRADPGSMLHASFTPADIGRLVTRRVNVPKWLYVGGMADGPERIADVLEFALGGADQAWVARAPLARPTSAHATTLSAAGLPLVIGGFCDDRSPAVDEFTLRHNSWRSVAALSGGRCFHTATTVDRDVFVCGGETPNEPLTSDFLVLRAGATAWAPATPMPISIVDHACSALAQSHRYDCASDRWTRLGDLNSSRYSLCGETLGDGAVYVCGGWWSTVTERLDVRTGTWQVVAPLPATVRHHEVCLFDAMTMVSLGGVIDNLISPRCTRRPMVRRAAVGASQSV